MEQRDDSADETSGRPSAAAGVSSPVTPTIAGAAEALMPPLPMPPRLYPQLAPATEATEDDLADRRLKPPLPMPPGAYGWTPPNMDAASAPAPPPPHAPVSAPLEPIATAFAAVPETAVVSVQTVPTSVVSDAPPTSPSWLDVARRVARLSALAFAGWIAAILLFIVIYRVVDPPFSSLMLQQRLTGQDIEQHWVAIDNISTDVIRAVLLSEDGRFCEHSGVDYEEMQNAIDRARDGAPRGASTISMQVIKNLFLWPSKSYIRKAIEIPLTYAMEAAWPKERIMEVYLNIAEWGPGIFGVEAASQHHFSKSARRLNEREAARLAVALPNPFLRDAGDPGPRTRRLAADIEERMRASPRSQTACVVAGRSRRPVKNEAPPQTSEDDWDAIVRPEP
ncbi:MAG: monofunctional biosynthetic peptidoglycan transglycosylase [Hyphomicrobium sp.]